MLQLKDITSNYVDKKVKCISNASGNGLTVGQFYYIKSKGPANAQRPTITVSATPGGPMVGGWGYVNEFDHPTISTTSLKDDIATMRREKIQLNENIKTKEDLLQFMKDNELTEIDPDIFKTFKIMKKLNLGTLDDAKEVVEILNS